MWQHLEKSHVEEFCKAKEDALQYSTAESPCNREKLDLDIRMQLTLPQAFQVKNSYLRTSTWRRTLIDSACYFIAKDMQSYQTVNNPSFQHLVHSFDQRYHAPDRKTLSTNDIPRLYDREKEWVSSALSNVDSFALTTDIWTSRHNQAYTGLTGHYVDDCYQLQSHLLENVEFPQSHMGINISEKLEAILEEWKLPQDNLSTVTTDNGTNIVSALEILQWNRMPCFSHTLQLTVEVVLSFSALARCR